MAHLAMMSPAGALSRDPFRVVVATSQCSLSGGMIVALAGTVTSRPPLLLLRKVTASSAGSHGRLCSPGPDTTYAVPATATIIPPDSEHWDVATTALKGSRLNAPAGDIIARWAIDNTVYALTPHGEALDGPDNHAEDSGVAQPAQTPATTRTWQPWHYKGRPKWRRGTRR